MRNEKKYTVDNLPEFSPWPARLLGIEPFLPKTKNCKELIREFETEKWSPLLKRMKKFRGTVTIDQIDEWISEPRQKTCCTIGNSFKVLEQRVLQKYYIKLIENTLKPFLPAAAISELGCGYGNIILRLAKSRFFPSTHFQAGEYTSSGVELTKRLALAQGLNMDIGHCDFTSKNIADFKVLAGSIIFTSYAVHYVPKLSDNFIYSMLKLDPKVVVHFEPCYEHQDNKSLLGLMRRRYIEINDYNTNLVSCLYKFQAKGKIKILKETNSVFGENPLLPISVLAWIPI